MRHLILAAAATLQFGAVGAHAQAENEAQWLRYPAISPDGTQIAFSYAGQIWTVPSQGGEARAITSGPWHSTRPVWSPDGSRIAFSSDRHGNEDVFVMPSGGGQITRLSYHSADDHPMAFTPDGSEVVFSSARLGDPVADATNAVYGLAGLYERPYAVAVSGGRPRSVLPTTALNLSFMDEGRFLYEDNPSVIEQEWRKHQVSDAARDVWLYDSGDDTHRQISEFRGEDRDPVWVAPEETIYWLSEQEGSFNIWAQRDGEAQPRQITTHDTWPVRFLSAADDGTLAYAWNGGIWRKDAGSSEPERVSVTIGQGSLIEGQSIRDVTGEVSEMAISPDGREIAIVARGELFVIGRDSKVTRRITETVAKETDVSFSADGRKLVYASERNGDWDIFEAALVDDAATGFAGPFAVEERLLIDDDADLFGPKYDPAGTRVAYIRNRSELRLHDIVGGGSMQVQAGDEAYSYTDGDLSVSWSPDGNWLLSRKGIFGTAEVMMIAADGGQRQNISLNGFADFAPKFSPDGSVVIWGSDRFGLRATTGDPEQFDVIASFLTRETAERFAMTDAERARLSPEQDMTLSISPGVMTPEFEGLDQRTVRLTQYSAGYEDYGLTADNGTLVTVAITPDYMLSAQATDLHSGEVRQIFALPLTVAQGVEFDPALTGIYVLSPGSVTRYDIATGQPAPIPFQAELSRDIRAEVEYIIRSNWRATNETFYRPDMQGVDWVAVRDHYLQFAPHIYYWEDLVDLLGEMVGELNASHQNPVYRAVDPMGDMTGVLGLYYDDSYRGAGMRIADVMPGGPSDRHESPLVPGATITSVDGKPITPTMSIDRLLNRKAGHEVRLTVQSPDSGAAVDHVVTPISTAMEFELAYQRWVDKRRAMVADLSDGRIGYIHLRAMMLEPYQTAYGDLFGQHADAEAVVVDIRANGGGNLHDQLIVMLTGQHDANSRARDGHVVMRHPMGRWTRPSAVLQNAGSYSDGSVFPMLYKQKGIGPIIGDRTPGTGTAVTNVPQLEAHMLYRVPELGFQLTDGTWFENAEIEPDVLIHNDPQSVAKGRDLQLEAAVTELLELID